MRPRFSVVFVALLVALGAACGGGDQASTTIVDENPAPTPMTDEPEQDAGDFMKEITEQSIRGQYGRVWETLHPSHQAIVTRDRFDACERDDNGSATKIDVELVETYEEPVAIKGTDETADSSAVTLRFSYNNPLTGKPAEEHQTLHAVPVSGEWKWILAPKTFDSYVKGECPTN